jgi:hypothetical protein
MGDVRCFVARTRLCGLPLRDLDDVKLRGLLRTGVLGGELAVLRESEGGAATDSRDARLRRLVREIGARSGQRLGHAGRQYRLVADAQWARLPDRDSYDVVNHRDAVAVLQGLAEQVGPELAKLLLEATGLLTQDWRPPLGPDGLVLLRKAPRRVVPKPDLGPALTPSQIKRLMEEQKEEIIDWTLWIELDPDDPKAQDDTVILLDAGYEEVERMPLSGCPKSGSGVLVIFKQVDKYSRYTLIRDYGPDEGGGQDTLFIDRSPAELEEECKKSS